MKKTKAQIDADTKRILGSGGFRLIATVSLRGAYEFIASYHFYVGTTDEGVRISFLGENFRSLFLNELEETCGSRAKFRVYKSTGGSPHVPTIIERSIDHRTDLVHLCQLLKKQPKGGRGPLSTNGNERNFFCISDDKIHDNKVGLWEVEVYWEDDGWHIDAGSLESSAGCRKGDRIFAR